MEGGREDGGLRSGEWVRIRVRVRIVAASLLRQAGGGVVDGLNQSRSGRRGQRKPQHDCARTKCCSGNAWYMSRPEMQFARDFSLGTN